MTSDNWALFQAHKGTSEGTNVGAAAPPLHQQQHQQQHQQPHQQPHQQRHLLAGSSHQNPSSPQSSALFDHNSSNFLSPAFSATTANSRPVSGISSLPSPTFRDSVISIIDDPFFQKLRDLEQIDEPDADAESNADGETEGAFAATPRHAYDDDDDNIKKQDAAFSNFSNPSEARPSPRRSGRPSERSRRESRDDKKPPAKQVKWPPPRRESLTVGALHGWSGVSNWV
jgi:hypothetical protein